MDSFMKWVREANVKGAFIPRSALALSGFAENEEAILHTPAGAVILVKRDMTAADMIKAIDALTQTASDLTVQLANACGSCDDCGGAGCPYDGDSGEPVKLQDFLREEAGIPKDAKLCAEVDDENHTVTFFVSDHKHDLSDVPKAQLVMLDAAGVCLGELERHLMTGDVIYRG